MMDETFINSIISTNNDDNLASIDLQSLLDETRFFAPLIEHVCKTSKEKNEPSLLTSINQAIVDAFDQSISKSNEQVKEQIDSFIKKESFSRVANVLHSFEYYTDSIEYNGVVTDIDYHNRSFTSCFYDINSKNQMISTFSFDDLAFDDDAEKIQIGTMFVLIVGKKRTSYFNNGRIISGGKENFCRIYLRTSIKANPKEEELINEDTERWSKLFDK